MSSATQGKVIVPLSFLGSDGMRARVRDFDWAATPLGPAARWCPELVTAVGFVAESRFPTALVWGAEMVTIYNDAFRPILGDKPEALGHSFAEVWAEAWDTLGPIAARAYGGEATFIEDFPLVIDRFGYPEQAYFTFSYSPVRLGDGTVAGMIDTVVETTASVQNRERLRMINGELGHRYQNAITLVQAMAHQSLRDVRDRTAVDTFDARLKALGEANGLLLQSDWRSTSIACAAEQLIAIHGAAGNIAVSGADVALGPQTTLALSLILHELATNAAKHGALSADGKVVLDWTIEEEDLVVTWTERGGPPAREGTRRGFGTRIIDAGLTRGGAVSRRYDEAGLAVEIRAPIARIAD